jgi:methionine-rich copper-binding protein CopC
MRIRRFGIPGFLAALLLVCVTGCGKETVNTAPPLVGATTPANGATGIPVNQTLTAVFSEAINPATINTTTFTLTGPGGAAVAGTVSYSTVTGMATFTPNANLAFNTLYTATITTGITDTLGVEPAANTVWSFRTAPTAITQPAVISTTPANGATSAPISQAVTATFNEAMNPATINAATFTLKAGAAAVTGTVTYTAAGSVATFTPAAALAVNTLYTATITTGAMDLAGHALAANYIWTFTTAAAPDTTRPTVLATIPANAAINVPANQILSATFSKAMNAATINAATFTLAGPGVTPVTGQVVYSSVGNTATFTPAANLAAGVYTATITTGAADQSGNTLAANFVWTFTVGATLDTTKPLIVSTIPINGAINVPANQAVSATFSEAMNPLTITTTTFTLVGPGATQIAGAVSYDPINFIATFTPTTNLAAGSYTADITAGATDLAGNTLGNTGAPNPWTFTAVATVVPPPVNLGTAALFGDFGGNAGMTNSGSSTVINGDIGTTGVSTTVVDFHDTAGCSYGETPVFTGGLVNGTIDTAPPPPTLQCSPNEGTTATSAIATKAAADALTAYGTLAAFPGGIAVETCVPCGGVGPGAGELGTRTLAPGIYKSTPHTYAITAGPLTLDAQGDPNAFWVFQMSSSLTVGTTVAPQSVLLTNGAQAKNVFWQVGTAATINGILGGGTMVGTIIAQSGVTVSTAGVAAITTINGRLLSLVSSVTIVNTVINVPAP